METITRRGLLYSAAGYALATHPITAWAITTPDTDLVAGDVKIKIGKEEMPAYAARPKKVGNYPVVIVVQEIFGLHEYIRDVVRRFANAGYYAVAPSLYFRQGDATKISDIQELRTKIVDKVQQDVVMSDLDAVCAWLKDEKGADAAKVGITGFCWGGNVTWMYSQHNPKLKAGVAWYGRLVGDPSPNMKHFPIEGAAAQTVPVLGFYGAKDKGIPVESVDRMRAELKKGKSGSDIIVYADADHGFHADYRPMYNEKDAKEAWDKALKWFKDHGLS